MLTYKGICEKKGERFVINMIMDYALILGIIYNSNSMWALASDNFAFSCFVLCVLAAIYYGIYFWVDREKFRAILTPVCMVMLFTFVGALTLAIVHADNSIVDGTWVQYMLILPLLLGCLLVRGADYVREELFPRLVFVAGVLASVAVVFWFLSVFFHLSPISTTSLQWTNGEEVQSFFGVYYNVQDMWVGDEKIWRNSSIFTEPLCACAFYGIVIALDLFVCRRRQLWCDAVMLIVLLTSLSTGAYIYTIVLLMVVAIRKLHAMKDNEERGLSRYLTFANICILICVGIYACIAIAIDKITSSYSGQIHYDDFFEGLKIWIERPLLGFGLKSDNYVWVHYASQYRESMAYTSGLIFILIHGGILLLMYIAVPWLLLLVKRINPTQLYFALLLLLLFVISPLQNYALFLLVLSYGYLSLYWSNVHKYSTKQ